MIKAAFAFIAILTVALVACGGGDEAGVADGPPPIDGTAFMTGRGVQVIEFAAGDGDPSQLGDAVAVHYTGWLANGTKFDSSYDRGNTFTFVLGEGQVIPGWEEGILGMVPGDARRLIIPPDLAYGDRGFGDTIPPGATLTFDVELIAFGRSTASTPEAAD